MIGIGIGCSPAQTPAALSPHVVLGTKLKIWWSANAVTLSGSNVTNVVDLSGNGNDGTPTGTPTWSASGGLSGRPRIIMPGGGVVIRSPTITLNQPTVVIAVFKPTLGTVNVSDVFFDGKQAFGCLFADDSGNGTYSYAGNVDAWSSRLADATWQCIRGKWLTGTNNSTQFINGVAKGTGNTGATTANGFCWGGTGSATRCAPSSFSDVFVLNADVAAAELTKLNRWLTNAYPGSGLIA